MPPPNKIPVLYTPGVNHTTVAEHTFLLLLALEKNFLLGVDSTRAGGWKRQTGHELLEKTIGIVGLGRIGKEVAIRAQAFGMKSIAYDLYFDEKFAVAHGVQRARPRSSTRFGPPPITCPSTPISPRKRATWSTRRASPR